MVSGCLEDVIRVRNVGLESAFYVDERREREEERDSNRECLIL